jgi:membrane dipeptidase
MGQTFRMKDMLTVSQPSLEANTRITLSLPVVKMTLEALDTYNRLGLAYPKYFTLTPDSYAAEQAFEAGRLISPVIIEGLHQIGNSTWNCHNKYADAALESNDDFSARIATPYWRGLSPAGRDLVLEMNRLGMLVDLAHVSTDTMRDVLTGNGTEEWKGSIAPPIFSHSSAYAICPHPRNVPDDILHLVKKRNSIVMVNFSPGFVSCKPGKTPRDLPVFDPENSTLDHVVKHIKHIGELIGYDHVGLGTDYDGIESTPKGLEDVSKFPDLVAELLRQGISDRDVGKIVGRNILRVWKEADEVAAKLQKTIAPLEDEIQNLWSAEKSEL